ncbi:hypothetical protein As57867_003209, partial [Aphanomyces stellatus]
MLFVPTLDSVMPYTPLLLVGLLLTTVTAIGFRAPSLRWLVFELLGRAKGIPIMWIESPAAATRVLKASTNKGEFLERIFSTPAWAPIISMESCDDPQWSAMKVNLVTLMKSLRPVSELQAIAHRLTTSFLQSHDVVDSPALSYLSVAAFYEWIFNRPFPDSAMFVCEATWELRKQIAIKGECAMTTKLQVIDWIQAEIKATPALMALFGAKWDDPEYFSLLLQPFLISPAINITDIAVRLHQVYKPHANVTDAIHFAIDTSHPFVLFERYLEHGVQLDDDVIIPPGTHVFMPVDAMVTDSVMRFGAGPRKCPGAHIGMACMLGMFTSEVLESPKFQPKLGH